MSSNAQQPSLASDPAVDGDAPHESGTPLLWVRHVLCGLSGHEYMLQTARQRLFLRCLHCGRESIGWTLDDQ